MTQSTHESLRFLPAKLSQYDTERPVTKQNVRVYKKPISVSKNPDRLLQKKNKLVSLGITKKRDIKYYDNVEPQVLAANFGPAIIPHKSDSFLEISEYDKVVPQVFPNMFSFKADLGSSSLEAISDLTEALGDIKINVGPDDKLVSSMNSLSANLSSAVADVNVTHSFGSMPGITSFFDLLSKGLPSVLVLAVLIVMIIYYLPKSGTDRALFAILLGVISATYLNNKDLTDYINSWFVSSNASPQVAGPDDLSTLLAGVLNVYLCIGSGRKIFSPTEMHKLVGTMSRTTSSVKSISDSISILINFIREKLDGYFNTGSDSNFALTGQLFIDNFLVEAKSIRDDFDAHHLTTIQSSVDRVKSAIELGNSVVMKIGSHSSYIGIRMIINNCVAELTKIKKVLLSSNFKFSGVRQEPVAVLLRGPPGCGKSLCMQHLAHGIASRTFSDEDYTKYRIQPSLFIYNRQFEQGFWDGYDQMKRFVFFDDLLQARDVEGNPDNEIMNVIRAINVFENQLHCAALEQKGNTMLRSEFIIANSNMTNYNFKSINESAAFMRRWDVVIDVCPSPEYCIDPSAPLWGKSIDHTKLKVHPDGSTRLHPDMLEFHLMTRNQSRFVEAGSVMNFSGLVDLVCKVYDTKSKWYSNYLADLNDTLTVNRGVIVMDPVEEIPVLAKPELGPSRLEAPYLDRDNPQGFVDEYKLWVSLTRSEYSVTLQSLIDYASTDWFLSFDENISDAEIISCCHLMKWYHHIPLSHEVNFTEKFVMFLRDLRVILRVRFGRVSQFSSVLDSYSRIDDCVVPQVSPFRSLFSSKEDMHQAVFGDALPSSRPLTEKVELFLDEIKDDDYGLYISVKLLFTRCWLIATCGYNLPVTQDDLLDRFIECRGSGLDPIDSDDDNEFIDAVIHSLLVRPISKPTYISRARDLYTSAVSKLSVVVDSVSKSLWEAYCFCWYYMVNIAADISCFGIVAIPIYWQNFNPYLWKAAGIAVVIAIVVKAFIMYFPPAEPQSSIKTDRALIPRRTVAPSRVAPHSDVKTDRVRGQIPRRMASGISIPKVAPHSVSNTNSNLVDVMHSVVKRNMLEYWRPLASDESFEGATHELSGFVVGLTGHYVLMPFHFMSQLKYLLNMGLYDDKSFIQFRKCSGQDVVYDVSVSDLVGSWVEDDLADSIDTTICEIKSISPFRDITKLFATEAQVAKYNTVSSVLYMPFQDADRLREAWPVISRRKDKTQLVGSGEFAEYKLVRSFEYTAHTNGGDCGSILFANDKSQGSLILGIHVAGTQKSEVGFSSIITQEILSRLLGARCPTVKVLPMKFVDPALGKDISNMDYAGIVPENLASHSSGRSNVSRTPLYGAWGQSKFKPAHLQPFVFEGNKVDPMAIAQSKCCKPNIFIPSEYLDQASASLYDYLISNQRRHLDPSVFSFDVAVLGDSSGFFSAVPRVTSAGFPYNGFPGKKSKERFFGTEPDYDLDNPECFRLRVAVEAIIRDARLGIRHPHVNIDFLKDEKRKVAKVDAGETRLVSSSPTPLLLVNRMYFGSFMKWMNMNSIYNGTCITINEHSTDWDILARKLLSFASSVPNLGAGDYKNFDMCELPSVHWKILAIIETWYDTPGDAIVRHILWYEIVNSVHLCLNRVSYWTSSLPSGHAMTNTVNDLYNGMVFRMAWMDNYQNVDAFNDNCYLMVRGDDNVYSVSDGYLSFTEAKLSASLAKFGLTYTSEDKDNPVSDVLRDISEVTFLKRRFVWCPIFSRYIAPLDLDSIVEIPYWTSSSANQTSFIEAGLVSMFEELSLHSQTVFEDYKRRVIKALSFHPSIHPPSNLSYPALRRIVLNRDTFYALHPQVRLRTTSTEFYDKKDVGTLSCGRYRAIEPYCQGDIVAIPQSPRSHNSKGVLVQTPLRNCTAEMNNQSKHEATDATPLGQQEGSSFVRERTDDTSESFPMNSTTHSTNDAETTKSRITAYKPLDSSFLTTPHTGVTQEVRDFLAKPLVMATGNFASTDTFAVNKFSLRLPTDLINAPLWQSKVTGNFAFRATTVFTLQVNANRFQQGRYIMAWIPDGGGCGNAIWQSGHSANLCQVTQLPHVEIDINCDTEAVLEIPHISCVGYAPLLSFTAPAYNLGTVIMRPYSPLVSSTGSTTAGYNVYVHFKDIDFTMPVVPQSGRVKTRNLSRAPPAEVEAKGFISSTLTKASTAAGILSAVPFLSSIAGPVSWGLDIASKIAVVFGWGKPHDPDNAKKMVRYVMPQHNNTDTLDPGTKLSVFDSACVEEMIFGGTDLDELSLGYLTSIPAWVSTIPWTEALVEGSILLNYSVSPITAFATSVYGTNTVTFPTPLAFCAHFYELYRGSLKFTFKVVKTEFHTGRLLLSFYPYDWALTAVPGPPTISQTAYLHREIIDIRYGNEFVFTAPYTSFTPYRPVYGTDAPYGLLNLTVLNPLVAPGNVSATVTILLEISAGPDMEFAVPRSLPDNQVFVVTPQSGRRNVCEIVSTDMGNSTLEDSLVPAKACIGERVLSLRSLLKRFNPLITNSGTPNFYLSFYPWSLPQFQISAANLLISPEVPFIDVFNQISSCFALSRGSVRYKFFDTINTSPTSMYVRTTFADISTANTLFLQNFQYSPTTVGLFTRFGNGDNHAIFYNNVSAGCEVEFPYYNRSFCHAVSDTTTNNSTASQAGYNTTGAAPRTWAVFTQTAITTGVNVFRAAGEDFNLGLFISVPGYLSWTTTAQ
jgi:hypothetical protein